MGEKTLSDISPSFNKSIKVNHGQFTLEAHFGVILGGLGAFFLWSYRFSALALSDLPEILPFRRRIPS